MQAENIYALAHGDECDPTFFYCGKTVKSVQERFADHVRGANDPSTTKAAYEYMRHIGVDEVRVVFLDTTENGLTENDYVRTLIEAGHPLQNANTGNTKVAAMPQRSESGLRFRLDVESAQQQGQAVRLPPRLYLAWYADRFAGGDADLGDELQRQPAALQAGERWQFTVRLKAPHGASNPFGYDFELWLWEQGLQATGYVRAGPKDPTPQRLIQTHRHPVELARQRVREQIVGQVEDRKYAGLIAALVVGDQNAIDRADWDVFRATGVAHLMRIK